MSEVTPFLNFAKDIGPYGTVLIVFLFLWFKQKQTIDGRDGEENKEQITKLSAKIDALTNSINEVLVEHEKKVSYEWIEKELPKYQSKETNQILLDNLKESLKRAHERIDHLEKNHGKI